MVFPSVFTAARLRAAALLLLAGGFCSGLPYAAAAETTPAPQQNPDQPRPASEPAAGGEQRRFDFEIEPNAYYTPAMLFISLTQTPIPHVGEKSERDIYTYLLTRSLSPRFLVLEASVNPMPYFGAYLKREHRGFYDDAQVSGSFNWIKAVTAGFEEPWAVSVLVGNLVDFNVPERKEISGKGYSGFLYSAGNYHIKDNVLVKDDWREFEWKIKGDWNQPERKLSWSFRIGAKLHENPFITDILYVALRRSRLDFNPKTPSLFNNSGFEYTYDMGRRGLGSIRHYFYVDKKWPFENKKIAFSLALGFVWESAKKYTGPLAVGRENSDFQVLLRPNIEF